MFATAIASPASKARSTTLHVGLWIAQLILFSMFAFAGFLKLTTPIGPLSQTIPWVPDVPVLLVRFIGLSELAAARGAHRARGSTSFRRASRARTSATFGCKSGSAFFQRSTNLP